MSARAGVIPLRVAVAAFLVFLVGVGCWTWSATRTASDGRQTIVFWGSPSQMGEEVYTLLRRFEQAHPQYRVVMSSAVARDLTGDAQRLLTAVAGGVPPDLVFFDRFAVGQWADRHALTDLRPFLAAQDPKDGEVLNLQEYYPWAVEEASYRPPGATGPPGIYGIPLSADIRVLWTNRGALQQEGIIDPVTHLGRPPRTWEELREDGRRLTRFKVPGDPSSGLTRIGFAPAFGNSWLYIYAFEAGGSFLSADGLQATMASPPVVRALDFMVACDDDVGGYQQAKGFESSFLGGPLDPFLRGQVAMKIDGSWCLKDVAAYAPDDLDWAVSPAPMPADELAKGRAPITWAGGWSLVIPATARCKEGAFALARYLRSWEAVRLQQESLREQAESIGHAYIPDIQPNRVHCQRLFDEALAGNLRQQPRFREALLTFRALLEHTCIRPVTPVGQLLWNAHADATDQAENHLYRAQAQREGVDEALLALRAADARVQPELDALAHRASQPPPPPVHWLPFLVVYAIVVALAIVAIVVVARRRGRAQAREAGAGLLFAAPWLIGFAVLCGGPVVFAIVESFCAYDVLTPAHLVGTANYREVVHDPLFWKSLGNTAFMLLRIPLVMGVSLAIALLLNRALGLLGVYRTAFYIPAVMPVVAASLLWLWMFNPEQGLLSAAIDGLGDSSLGRGLARMVSAVLGHPWRLHAPSWLQDEHWTKPSLILMNLWSAGGAMIIWLAGLQGIPRQLYEAAAIDGAGPLRRFWHITLPMLSPYILFNLITGVIATMQIFTEAYIMSDNGKPNNSLLFYALYLFDQAFQYFRIGYAAALAWILFLLVLTLTVLQLWSSRRWVHYEQS